MIDFLKEQPAQSLNRFVLLDGKGWITAAVNSALRERIELTADTRNARVIFRAAGYETSLPASCLHRC